MRRLGLLTIGVLTALIITGCTAKAPAAEPADTAPVTPPPPVSQETPEVPEALAPREPVTLTWQDFPETTGEPQLSDRAAVIKKVGETGGINDDGVILARFMVTAITVDPECEADADEPANGHFVRLDIQAEGYAALADASWEDGLTTELWLQDWDVLDSNGIISNVDPVSMEAFTCLTEAEQLPSDVTAGQRALGSLVLDVPTTSGTLIMNYGGEATWEYAFPQ